MRNHVDCQVQRMEMMLPGKPWVREALILIQPNERGDKKQRIHKQK